MFKNLIISETAYELAFQESEPVFVYEEGVYGNDRTQDRDENTGFPLWTVRVTASNAATREEQALEVRVPSRDQPSAGFKEKVVMPNLRAQMYSRRNERGITVIWFADDCIVPGAASKPSAPPSSSSSGSASAKAAA